MWCGDQRFRELQNENKSLMEKVVSCVIQGVCESELSFYYCLFLYSSSIRWNGFNGSGRRWLLCKEQESCIFRPEPPFLAAARPIECSRELLFCGDAVCVKTR